MRRHDMAAGLIVVAMLSSACASQPNSKSLAESPEPSPTVTAIPSPTATTTPSPTVTAAPSPSEAPQPSPKVAPAWGQFPTLEPSGDIPVDEFNAYLESVEPPLATSPLRASIEFLHLDEPAALTTSVVMKTRPPEGGNQAVVRVTNDGLADDSIGAVRYVLLFERLADGTWRLRSATWAQRCQVGRGHRDFTPELCV